MKVLNQRVRACAAAGVLAATAFACLAAPPSATAAPAQRKLQIDDMFRLEEIGRYYGGPYSFAPDGALAFTRTRPKAESLNHKYEYLWGNSDSDVWIQSGTEAPTNITQGAGDGSGWWAPEWSPDGRHLAMLSTRDGNVRVWLWSRDTGQVRRLSENGADINGAPHARPFLWLDANRLLFPVLAEGDQPTGMKIELQTPAIATREWPKTPLGRESTASVLDSGVPVDLSRRPQGQLLLVDVASGRQSVVVASSTRDWQASPRGDAVAFARQVGIYQPRQGEPLPFGYSDTYALGLAGLDGSPIALEGGISRNIISESIRWSPDGTELAVLGYPGESRSDAPLLYRIDLASRRVATQPLDGLDAAAIVREQSQLEWTAAGELLLLAASRSGDEKPDVRARRDWWAVDRDGRRRNLTADLAAVPGELWPLPDRASFAGLAKGEIWRIHAQGEARNLTADFAPEVVRLQWPVYGNAGQEQWPRTGTAYTSLVFAVRDGQNQVPYRISLEDGRIGKIAAPAAGAELKAFEPDSGAAVFHRSDSAGLFVWRVEADGRTTPLVETNTFLREIKPAASRLIEYTSLNGEPLKAWMLLPPDHREGQRHPLLTWVYAGSVARAEPSPATDIGFPSPLNLQIAAAHGYAVLLPSMPLAPEGMADDPMLRLPEGVLPAVDKAVELGLADPQRLFLMGQSFGGYSTYGLVTQTRRFNAAVSLAGLSNLISLYGQFDARFRYTDRPQENLFQMSLTESAQVRMGGPPWEELNRYLRNSPIFQVDRVETPLMMIYGDLDYVAMQQGEEFFNSLYRQGKRARLVRYWGEGHVLESPANIRDMWARIFEWFEMHSPGGGAVLGQETNR